MAHANGESRHQIFGGDIQCLQMVLRPGESITSSPGKAMYYSGPLTVDSHFRGLLNFSVVAIYRNTGREDAYIAFSSGQPGRIIPVQLAEFEPLLCLNSSVLCHSGGSVAETGARLRGRQGRTAEPMHFPGPWRRFQALDSGALGNQVFLQTSGLCVEKALERGETIQIDASCLVAMRGPDAIASVRFAYGDWRGLLSGSAVLVWVEVTGPGTVWMQTLPINRLMSRVFNAARTARHGNLGGSFAQAAVGSLFAVIIAAVLASIMTIAVEVNVGERHDNN